MRDAVTPVRENYFVLQIEREQMIDAGRVEFPAEDAFLVARRGRMFAEFRNVTS